MFPFLPAHRLSRHLLFWLGVAVYFLIPQWIYPDYIDTVTHYFFDFDYQHSPYFLTILFAYTLGVGMLYAYAFLRWSLPPLLQGRYGVGIGLYALITVGICYLFRALKALHLAVIDPVLQGKPIQPFDARHFHDYAINQVYIHEYTTIILVLTVYKLFTNWLQKQQEANRLEREKMKTEIQLFKTQVNPDFMFNTLDQLSAYTPRQSKQASGTVLKLANYLSYVLYESHADQVPLERDIEAMRHYIELEKERFGNRIDLSVNMTGAIADQVIAPLLFLPFLENAFRHGVGETVDQAWMSLNLAVAGKTLKFSLVNSDGLGKGVGFVEGNGLKTIRKRLDALYPNLYELKLETDEDIFLVVLTIQLTGLQPFSTDPQTAYHTIPHHETPLSLS